VGLKVAIDSADFIVAQNAKFELQWLQREGVDISKLVVYDTLIGEYVRLGNRRGPKDLDAIAKRYALEPKLSIVKLLIHAGVCPGEIPKRWLVTYGCLDTEITAQVFMRQRRELSELRLLPHLYTRCLLTPVLADIERNGMQLDEERVNEEYNRAKLEFDRAEARLADAYPGINFSSRRQLGVLLYETLGFQEPTKPDGSADRTGGGAYRTDADTIEALEATTDAQRHFKEILKERTAAETELKSLKKMKDCCDEDGGLLYAKYNQAVTQNHRLSSSGLKYKLQFQNFARKFKPLFRARYPGWYIAEGDGRGMEFRTGVHLGRDPVGGDDIRSKKDVHRATASFFVRKPEDRVTKAERQAAKPETFRPMYYSFGQTPEQKEYAKYFHERYKGIFDTQTAWIYEVLKNKKLVTEWGLIFYWPDCKMSKSGYIKYSTNIANYPISCLATGEIIPIGLVHCWHYIRALKLHSFLVNTIHDSVVGEVPEHETEIFRDIVNRALTHDTFRYLERVYNLHMTVPLGVEMKFGRFWGESEGGEYVYEVDPLKKD